MRNTSHPTSSPLDPSNTLCCLLSERKRHFFAHPCFKFLQSCPTALIKARMPPSDDTFLAQVSLNF
jgi:hypothetical protein